MMRQAFGEVDRPVEDRDLIAEVVELPQKQPRFDMGAHCLRAAQAGKAEGGNALGPAQLRLADDVEHDRVEGRFDRQHVGKGDDQVPILAIERDHLLDPVDEVGLGRVVMGQQYVVNGGQLRGEFGVQLAADRELAVEIFVEGRATHPGAGDHILDRHRSVGFLRQYGLCRLQDAFAALLLLPLLVRQRLGISHQAAYPGRAFINAF